MNYIEISREECSVTFNEEFDRDAAKLFYGVGDTTIGMTHSFWAGGLITVTGKNTHEAFKTYLSRGLQNTSNLPDDHLAVELAFLGHLLAEDKIDEAQQFVKNEILAWWPTAEQNIDSKTQNAGIKAFFASVTTALKFLNSSTPLFRASSFILLSLSFRTGSFITY